MTDYAPPASIQDEMLAFLLSTPTPQNIIDFHASESAQDRPHYLLEVNRQGTLSDDERAELNEASQMNHLIMRLIEKMKQRRTIKGGQENDLR